eukprot:CAMPEP_0175126944 /NCGR_PEP_ID=MMETSP0087-20121206/4129_1 /TAXON_ID=136419 /ORGANISM="Unknown Unknown, Strain D1" /LENGTH=1515 /DNA_ID=CAMNT_0016408901 /DNA_START=199 /DNA_END=4746 /DNA_ORIENTATION=+
MEAAAERLYQKVDHREEKANECNIQVVVRCRPRNQREKNSNAAVVLEANHEESTVELNKAAKNAKSYTFDQVYTSTSTQQEVFEGTVAPIVDEVLDGFNCTVFAYGQTGTGKTHTMEGNTEVNHRDQGIIPRAVRKIFEHLEANSKEYSVRVSYLELYNEELADLMTNEQKNLRIFEDATGKKGMMVHNLEEVLVSNSEEVFGLLKAAQNRRVSAETALNKNSSRSHAVFTITLHTKESNEGEDVIKTGKLNLVDLAGSECIGRSGAVNNRAKEAGKINQSLLTLGRVINSLVEKAGYVPYRDSKLTRLLQESLGGKAKTCIIATVSPAVLCLDETVSTLEYAHRAKNIRNRPVVNQKVSQKAYMRELVHEITMLKKENDALRNKNGVYMPQEKWNAVETELKTKTILLEENEMALNQKVKELEQLQQDFTATRAVLKETEEGKKKVEADLDRTEKVLKKTEVELDETKTDLTETATVLGETLTTLKATHVTMDTTDIELTQTEADLDATKTKLDETEHIVKKQKSTEEQLFVQASELKTHLEDTIEDTVQLHAKVGRVKAVEKTNMEASTAFKVEFNDNIESLQKHFDGIISAQSSAYGNLQSQVDVLVSRTVEDMNQLNSTVDNMWGKIGSKASAISEMTSSYTESSIKFCQAFVAKHNEQQKVLNGQIEAAKSAMAEAVADLRTKLAEQEKQNLELQNMVTHNLKDNIENISNFANQSAASMTAMRNMFDSNRDSKMSELSGMRSFIENMVAEMDAESKKVMMEVLFAEQSAAQKAYSAKVTEQAAAMEATRSKVESESESMADSNIQKMESSQASYDAKVGEMAKARSELNVQAKELAAKQAEVLSDANEEAETKAKQMAEKQDSDFQISASAAEKISDELNQETAKMAQEHVAFLEQVRTEREALAKSMEEEGAKMAAEHEARVQAARVEAEELARSFEKALAESRAKAEAQAKQMAEETRALAEKRAKAVTDASTKVEAEILKLQKNALEMAHKRACALQKSRADTEAQARDLIKQQSEMEKESRTAYSQLVKGTAVLMLNSMEETSVAVEEQFKEVDSMVRSNTAATITDTQNFMEQTSTHLASIKVQRETADQERNSMVESQFAAFKDVLTTERSNAQTRLESSVETLKNQIAETVEQTTCRHSSSVEAANKHTSSAASWNMEAQAAFDVSVKVFAKHSDQVMQSRSAIAQGVEGIETDLSPRIESFLCAGGNQTTDTAKFGEQVNEMVSTFGSKHQGSVNAMTAEHTDFVAEQNLLISKVKKENNSAGAEFNSSTTAFTESMAKKQTEHNGLHTDMHAQLDTYVKDSLISDQPTGQTPAKKTFDYPKTFAQTGTFDTILEQYRSEEQDVHSIIGGTPVLNKRKTRFEEKSALTTSVTTMVAKAIKKAKMDESAPSSPASSPQDQEETEEEIDTVSTTDVQVEQVEEVQPEPEVVVDKENAVPEVEAPEEKPSKTRKASKAKKSTSPPKKAKTAASGMKSPLKASNAAPKRRTGLRAPRVTRSSANK